MRYEKGHKDATRARIVDVASRQFRENGVAAAGLAGIMAEAGLTNGAFYAHFKSKEDLLRAVLADALGRRETTLRTASERGAGLEATIRDYLSPRHRDDPGRKCCNLKRRLQSDVVDPCGERAAHAQHRERAGIAHARRREQTRCRFGYERELQERR